MAIVLAIEPDRRQAAHLTAIVRHQVGVELVVADTTEGALDAIGNRVPDLVLVPALLSPQDDAALAAALRVIAAAAHVRTLTIPVLGSGAKRTTAGGMLAKWRRSREASPEPDGCDPAVFGEQIAAYLKEAADERAQIAEDMLDDEPYVSSVPTPAPAPPPVPIAAHEEPEPIEYLQESIEPEVALFATSDPTSDPTSELTSDPISETYSEPDSVIVSDIYVEAKIDPPAVVEDPPFDAIDPLWSDDVAPMAPVTLAFETIEQALNDLEASAPDREEPLLDLSEELENLKEDETDADVFDGEPIGVYTIGDGAPEAEAVQAAEPQLTDPSAPPRADLEPWVPMYLTPGRMWPALEGVPAETPVARTDQPDWIELVASLRQDIERRRTEPASAKPRPVAARPSDGANAEAHRVAKKPRAPQVKQGQPIQDEWGFFDPEQCGFSTLLAKLEEITEDGTIAR
jgi:hypothetical protein